MVDDHARSLSYRLTRIDSNDLNRRATCFGSTGSVRSSQALGSGIGEATARLFAAQGAQILVADVQMDAAEQVAASIVKQGGSASALALDVADETQVCAAFDRVANQDWTSRHRGQQRWHQSRWQHPETSLEDWDRVLRVNAGGVFLCAREAVRHMLQQEPKGGVIINLSSVAAMIGLERRLPYSASKGAVLSLTRSIAIDFVGEGIRCNAICPGTVHTPFVEGYLRRSFPGRKTLSASSCTRASLSGAWDSQRKLPLRPSISPRMRLPSSPAQPSSSTEAGPPNSLLRF